MTGESPNGWNEHKLLVLEALERFHKELRETRRDIQSLEVRLARLDVRAGLLGALAGSLPGLVIATFAWLKYVME